MSSKYETCSVVWTLVSNRTYSVFFLFREGSRDSMVCIDSRTLVYMHYRRPRRGGWRTSWRFPSPPSTSSRCAPANSPWQRAALTSTYCIPVFASVNCFYPKVWYLAKILSAQPSIFPFIVLRLFLMEFKVGILKPRLPFLAPFGQWTPVPTCTFRAVRRWGEVLVRADEFDGRFF